MGKIPKQLGSGEIVQLYKDGQPGPGGTVGNHKINKNDGDRHFSVSQAQSVQTKMIGDKITDQYGRPIEQLRKQFDIERAPKVSK